MEKRIVAFDIGDKRVGVALSDPFNRYAVPCETYFRTGDLARDADALVRLAEEESAGAIVCGLPLNADGTESVQTQKTRRFLAALAERTDIPVLTEDERYTTREARGDLAFMGVSAKKDKRKKTVDSLAAAYILETYLSKIEKGDKTMSYKEEQEGYEEEDNIVELVDDEGATYRYEHVGTVEYRGEWYCCLVPVDDEDDGEEGEVVIFHIVGDEDSEELEAVEDDVLLDEIFAEYRHLYGDSDDADEAAALEPSEED